MTLPSARQINAQKASGKCLIYFMLNTVVAE
jgi:hypothetical protein